MRHDRGHPEQCELFGGARHRRVDQRAAGVVRLTRRPRGDAAEKRTRVHALPEELVEDPGRAGTRPRFPAASTRARCTPGGPSCGSVALRGFTPSSRNDTTIATTTTATAVAPPRASATEPSRQPLEPECGNRDERRHREHDPARRHPDRRHEIPDEARRRGEGVTEESDRARRGEQERDDDDGQRAGGRAACPGAEGAPPAGCDDEPEDASAIVRRPR